MKTEILRMEYVSKSKNHNKVLQNICLDLFEGEIVKLVDKECEGKSAILEILGGVSQPDSGSIYVFGKEVLLASPQISQKLGINIIHQQGNLIPNLTVMENFFLGLDSISKKLFIHKKQQYKRSLEVLRILGISVTPDTLVANLTAKQVQLIQLGKALLNNLKIVVMDNTVKLLDKEQITFYKNLFMELTKKQVVVLILSSNIDDFIDIVERIYIMKDGSIIGNIKTDMADTHKILQIINQEGFTSKSNIHLNNISDDVMRIENLCTMKTLKDISFSIKKGEILGITGPSDSDKSELAYAIFGMVKLTGGSIYIHNKRVRINRSIHAIKHKIGLVPYDENDNGLIRNLNVHENITLTKLKSISKFIFIDKELENWLMQSIFDNLLIETSDLTQTIDKLSIGEQRKINIIRALAINPEILICIEPTKGLNSEDRNQTLKLLTNLSNRGLSIIIISSDFYEIIRVTTRVLMLNNGCLSGEVNENDISFDVKLM